MNTKDSIPNMNKRNSWNQWNSIEDGTPGVDGWYLTWDGIQLKINLLHTSSRNYKIKWKYNNKNIKYWAQIPTLPGGCYKDWYDWGGILDFKGKIRISE